MMISLSMITKRALIMPKMWLFPFFLLAVPNFVDLFDAEFVQLVEMVDLDNVTFTKSVRFADNGTLLEDIHLLDKLYTAETAQRHNKKRAEDEEKPPSAKKQKNKVVDQVHQRLEARILMVADHSLHETFMKLYGEDEYAAYTALSRYMLGVFTQLDTIFARLPFFTGTNSSSTAFPPAARRIFLKLAAPPMVIVRPEDCPLRGPMLIALHQSTAAANATLTDQVSSSADNSTTIINQNGTLDTNGESELDRAVANGIEGWNRLDALRAVQWIHRWIEHSEQMLPKHDHVMVLTRMDLISQRNDSATQGMAYVRAICRGADSVSVGSMFGTLLATVLAFVPNCHDSQESLAIHLHGKWVIDPSHISVVEDVGGLSTATVAAHELSHSLGAYHDGSDANANCSARQNFLMAPISASHTFSKEFGDTFPNAFVLSECSMRQIENFLSSAESECLRLNGGDDETDENFSDQQPSSLVISSSSSEFNNAHSSLSGDANAMLPIKLEQRMADEADQHQQHLTSDRIAATGTDGEWWSTMVSRGHGKPGEQFDSWKQCQIVFGSHYGNCRRKDFMLLNADPCRRLWCKNRNQRRWAPCETKGFLPMMDGTRCGDRKWCIRGACTDKSTVRKRSDELSRNDGDSNDCRDLNRSFCASFTAEQMRSFCRVPNFSRICCANCGPILRPKKNKWKILQMQGTDKYEKINF
ncbi:hypothetical protein niasHT_013091 [Heterodera trifolii]|uniref:Peptidase M12B domain-containing protein n=1 Tax=Heterodera trifolii TaxID=157864 RepID=A0ABD2L744_9BILA